MLGNVRKLYFNPRVRWWESAPRFATDFQARILNKGTDVGNGQIKNISVGGFFIEMSESLEEHQEVSIEFIHGDQKIEVLAMPVFHRESNPRGYGFKIHAGHSRKSGMLKLVKKMKSEGALVMGRAPTPEDSFGHWLRKAFRSPDAWVPKSRE